MHLRGYARCAPSSSCLPLPPLCVISQRQLVFFFFTTHHVSLPNTNQHWPRPNVSIVIYDFIYRRGRGCSGGTASGNVTLPGSDHLASPRLPLVAAADVLPFLPMSSGAWFLYGINALYLECGRMMYMTRKFSAPVSENCCSTGANHMYAAVGQMTRRPSLAFNCSPTRFWIGSQATPPAHFCPLAIGQQQVLRLNRARHSCLGHNFIA
jgi:hypothetical protein